MKKTRKMNLYNTLDGKITTKTKEEIIEGKSLKVKSPRKTFICPNFTLSIKTRMLLTPRLAGGEYNKELISKKTTSEIKASFEDSEVKEIVAIINYMEKIKVKGHVKTDNHEIYFKGSGVIYAAEICDNCSFEFAPDLPLSIKRKNIKHENNKQNSVGN